MLGKSLPGFAPIGPYISTSDEIPDPQNLRISLSLNGETRDTDCRKGIGNKNNYSKCLNRNENKMIILSCRVGQKMLEAKSIFLSKSFNGFRL